MIYFNLRNNGTVMAVSLPAALNVSDLVVACNWSIASRRSRVGVGMNRGQDY